MKTKMIRALLIAGLLVLSVTVVVADTEATEEDKSLLGYYQVTFNGSITNPDGSGVQGAEVEITKELGEVGSGNWESVGVATTSETGYTMTSRWYTPRQDGFVWGNYRMYLGDQMVDEEYISLSEWEWKGGLYMRSWSYQWSHAIPEFSTIAIPLATATLIGLLFLSRQRRKE